LTERARFGGGDQRRPLAASDDETSLVRHEEEVETGTRWNEVGVARLRREVESRMIRERYPRQVQDIAHERVPVAEGDSGEIEVLPDGSVSIPLFEEELVVTKRRVLREGVIVRKELVTGWGTVEIELRREHIAVDENGVDAA